MKIRFLKYFINYIFHSKTRQRLLIIAISGLFLSSFSLLVLQSIMGGLQKGLIKRSKEHNGAFYLKYDGPEAIYKKITNFLDGKDISYIPEYEIELLAKNRGHLSPMILHGMDYSKGKPHFLAGKDLKGIVLGADLGTKINAYFLSSLEIISPSHLNDLIDDVPRSVSDTVSDFIITDVGDLDSFHAWVRLSFVQNLIRKRDINKIRFYKESDFNLVTPILKKYKKYTSLITWEDENSSLVWALRLETTVMLLLFISMTLLVAVSITSGYMIFFSKVRTDMMSFWILGLPKNQVMRLSSVFTHLMSLFVCLMGIAFGLLCLFLLDKYSPNIMPDVFVERRLPVHITSMGIFISFICPYLVSTIFSFISLKLFKKDNESFLKLIRSVG